MQQLCAECQQPLPLDRHLTAKHCSSQCKRVADTRAARIRGRALAANRPKRMCANTFCLAMFTPGTRKVYCSPACSYVGAESKHGKGAAESAVIKVGQLVASRIWFFDCQDCGATVVRKWKRPGVHCVCRACSRRRYLEHNARKNHKRRAPGLPVLSVYQIAERDGCRCNICGRKVDLQLSGRAKYGPTIDHLTPISQGGTNAADNLALVHRACNVARGNRVPAQLLLTV